MKDFEALDDQMLENVAGGTTYEEYIGYGFSPECAVLWPLYHDIKAYCYTQVSNRSALWVYCEHLGRASAANDTEEAVACAKAIVRILRGFSDSKAAEFIAQLESVIGG